MTEAAIKPGEVSGQVKESGAFALLRQKLGEAVGARMAVGSLPAGPATLRARIGALLIGRIQRALFWLLPQLDRFHAAVIGIEQQQIRVSEEIAAEQRNSGARIRAVDGQVKQFQGAQERSVRELENGSRVIRDRLDSIEYAIRGTEERFRDIEQRFQLQSEEFPAQLEQFRMQIAHSSLGLGARESEAAMVEMPREALQSIAGILKNHVTGTPPIPVLAIGCGDGKWLEVLESAGFAGEGVEENFVLAAAGACKGLRIVAADPFSYIDSLPAGCMRAVTALNMVGRLSFPQLIALLDETVRILEPGGLSVFVSAGRDAADAQNGESGSMERKSMEMLAALAQLRGLRQTELICVCAENTAAASAAPADSKASLREKLPHAAIYVLVGRKS